MADIGTLNPEQMLEQQKILRQQKMAEMLMQQGMQQPQGQMVSGRYVAPSIFQNLAGLANTYVGQQGIERAQQAQVDLAKRLRADETSAMADFMQQRQGRPAIAGTPDIPTETYETVRGTPAQVATPPNPLAYENLYANPKASAAQRQFAFQKMNEGPMKVGAEDTLLDPRTLKPLFTGAGKPTTDMQNFEFAKNQGFKGSFTDFKNQITPYQQAQLNFDREKFEFEKGKTATKPLPEGLNKQVTGAVNLTDAIADYQTKIKGFGFKDFANPDKRAEMGNLYNNMMLQAKEAYNLGVLNGPDYDILQRVVKDPTNVSSLAFSNTALSKQADSLRKTSSDIVKNAYLSQGREVPTDISAKFVKKEEPKTEKKSVAQQLGLSKVPKGVDPKVWNVMTPEEKDLFK
jgi:hypothetical protein